MIGRPIKCGLIQRFTSFIVSASHNHTLIFTTMFSFSNLICFCTLIIFFITPVHSQQSYDKSECTSQSLVSGSNYLCTSKYLDIPCDTYMIYRAQKNFQSLSSISSLFHLNKSQLLDINYMSETDSHDIKLGREIIIPISCSCNGRLSQSIVMYNFSSSDSFGEVACGVFEGLVKAQSLIEENPDFKEGNPDGFMMIKVPIRCACAKRSKSANYVVTYPVIENDHMDLIASKFGVPEKLIWETNGLEPFTAIFPRTTLLIPTKAIFSANWDIEHGSEDPALSPKGLIPSRKVTSDPKTTILKPQLFLGIGLVVAFVFIVIACCIFICIRRKHNPTNFQPLSPINSVNTSNLSPDLLDGVYKLKLSLVNFTLKELRIATDDFDKASKIGTGVYRGSIGGSPVAIEQMNSEDAARHVMYILTKINHLNVVRLEGCCYESTPYLVLEYAGNGSLRDCLTNRNTSKQFTWARRMQIAFDLAAAIHYIHFCTKPVYVHRNINSNNVLITIDWRAKISGFKYAIPIICNEEKEEMITWSESVIVGRKGYLAPEYVSDGLASLKVDVFAYGVVLLELLSAKEVVTMEGKLLKESVNFLVEEGLEGSSRCLDKLKEFLDPALDGDYRLSDATCLIFLAKACIEEDPNDRPTMNDVLKALSRIIV